MDVVILGRISLFVCTPSCVCVCLFEKVSEIFSEKRKKIIVVYTYFGIYRLRVSSLCDRLLFNLSNQYIHLHLLLIPEQQRQEHHP